MKAVRWIGLVFALVSLGGTSQGAPPSLKPVDGGYALGIEDGGTILVRRAQDCSADAGVLLGLLNQRHCTRDADCAIFHSELRSPKVPCCTAMERRVLESVTFDEAVGELAEECGDATWQCGAPCQRARCRKSSCVAE
jgi:hypothetical protein